MNKIFLTLVVLVHVSGFAQQKPINPATWYSLVDYSSTTMVHNGEITIKNPATFLKDACAIANPKKQIDFYHRIANLTTLLRAEVDEGPEDENGKISTIHLRLKYQLGGDEDTRYSEIFYRDKKACLNDREIFKKWLEDQHVTYKARQSKYD